MSKIIGVTVGTPTSPFKMEQEIKPVKTVNGVGPDENGNVVVEGGIVDAVRFTEQTLTEEQKAQVMENTGAASKVEVDKKIGLIATFEEVPVEIDPSEFEPIDVTIGVTWITDTFWNDNATLESTANYTAPSELIPAVPNATYKLVKISGVVRIYNKNKATMVMGERYCPCRWTLPPGRT